MGIIMFNGVSSEDYGILVEHPPGYQTPERNYEVTHIPGRNGDVLYDTGSYNNAERTYEIAFGNLIDNYFTQASRVSQWLHEPVGYARLEDSYEPDVYRMGYFKDSVDFENILSHAGRATIKFDCKPQRYLKIGEDTVNVVNNTNVFNPTVNVAKPLIKMTVSGSGTISTNGGHITFLGVPYGTEIIVDTETMNAREGMNNANRYIVFDGDFLTLTPGDNVFTVSASIKNVEVIPRWWII